MIRVFALVLGRAFGRRGSLAALVALVAMKAETARARWLLCRLLHSCNDGRYPVFSAERLTSRASRVTRWSWSCNVARGEEVERAAYRSN